MAVETVTREGDFVIRGGKMDLLRIHITDEEMVITSDEYRGMHTITTFVEMKELEKEAAPLILLLGRRGG